MNAELREADMWVLVTASGAILPWAGARSTRKQMMAEAVKGCISATDYHRLDNDADRWKIARRRGYRIVRARITAHLGGENNG